MNQELRDQIRNVDLTQLEEQFKGAEYRHLVQQHIRKIGSQLELAILGAVEALTDEEKVAIEGLAEIYNEAGYQQDFWRRDCSEVFQEICSNYFDVMSKHNLPSEDKIAFNLFQIITMNFAIQARDQKALRKFIGIKKNWLLR